MIYLVNCDTLEDRETYRRAEMESKNKEWHREKIERFHKTGSTQTYKGSGSGSSSGITQKDKSKGIT